MHEPQLSRSETGIFLQTRLLLDYRNELLVIILLYLHVGLNTTRVQSTVDKHSCGSILSVGIFAIQPVIGIVSDKQPGCFETNTFTRARLLLD